MDNTIARLAETLLKEGVEQGEQEKARITAEAQAEAEAILSAARTEAERITAEALAESRALREKTEAELRRAAELTVTALQARITELIITEAVDKSADQALSNPAVMAECIRELISSWNGRSESLEIILPESLKLRLEESLKSAVSVQLAVPASFTFSKSVKSGFQIVPAGANYRISLSAEDFAGFFKEFLHPKIRTVLFGG